MCSYRLYGIFISFKLQSYVTKVLDREILISPTLVFSILPLSRIKSRFPLLTWTLSFYRQCLQLRKFWNQFKILFRVGDSKNRDSSISVVGLPRLSVGTELHLWEEVLWQFNTRLCVVLAILFANHFLALILSLRSLVSSFEAEGGRQVWTDFCTRYVEWQLTVHNEF